MDPFINPIALRHRTFGQIDRYSQDGEGLLSGFMKIFKKAVPFIKNAFTKVAPIVKKVAENKHVKKTVKELGEHALESGINAGKKIIAGEDISESLKSDLVDAGNIGLKGLNNLIGSSNEKNKKQKKNSKKRKGDEQLSFSTKKSKKLKKSKRKDIFT